LWGPFALIGCFIAARALQQMSWEGWLNGVTTRESRGLVAIPIILVTTLTLLVFSVPYRTAFLISRSAFEAALSRVPESSRGVPISTRLGVYRIDQYAADPRGGIFFRVHSGRDGIGPDTMSYGFAKRPNPTGPPFGNAHYTFGPMVGDWYWFKASNDY